MYRYVFLVARTPFGPATATSNVLHSSKERRIPATLDIRLEDATVRIVIEKKQQDLRSGLLTEEEERRRQGSEQRTKLHTNGKTSFALHIFAKPLGLATVELHNNIRRIEHT